MRFTLKGKRDVFVRSVFSFLLIAFAFAANAQIHDSVVVVLEPPAKEKEPSAFNNISKNYVPPLYKRQAADSMVKQLQQDEDFWYANQAIQKKKPKPAATNNFLVELMQEKWFRTLLWLLVLGAFAAVIIWYLSSLNIRLFRRQSSAIKSNEEEKLPDDIFAIPYEKSIEEAVQKNNFRLAVRLLYLQALTRLSQKSLIQFKQDRTNSDYLAQLYQTTYYKDFFGLTRSFEYTWYGQFALSKKAFELVQKDFETFNKKLP